MVLLPVRRNSKELKDGTFNEICKLNYVTILIRYILTYTHTHTFIIRLLYHVILNFVI